LDSIPKGRHDHQGKHVRHGPPERGMNELTSIISRRAALAEADLHPRLLRFIEGRLRDRSDSEDIVQETYLRLHDYRRTRTVADTGAFCFAVARNLIRDHLRRRSTHPIAAELPADLACPAPRADEILAYRERVDVLRQALRAMPALRREVFLRRRLDEQDVATISAALGIRRTAVEKHVSRGLADLRRALDRRGLGLGDGL
jgi:RNA polymerase sigma factor (sigma-70 family)